MRPGHFAAQALLAARSQKLGAVVPPPALAALPPEPPPPAPPAPVDPAEMERTIAAMLAGCQLRSPEELAAYEERAHVCPRLAESGIEARHFRALRDMPSSARREKQLRTFAAILPIIQRGGIAAIYGPRGTGKTQLAAELLRYFVEQERADIRAAQAAFTAGQRSTPCRAFTLAYTKNAALYARFKELFGSFGTIHADRREQQLAALATQDVLVMDELQEVPESTQRVAHITILTDILDRRYARKKPTLLISNHYDPENPASSAPICAFLGESAVSRLTEDGIICRADWESFRANPA